ncbi:hypothetical protein L218DRAFT_933823 [Marasmius fiardii PR-910]|nr:hypothetical protein L218DRAFT_933823 [Marasmius fiardii PR-910]
MLPNSPFTCYFDTNCAPSSSETARIQDILSAPLDELRQLNEEIDRLQAQRKILQSFIDKHRVILSPFRKVPADIWRVVFTYCLPPSGLPLRTITEAPILLTRICRSWREIALTTPGLWNSIHINAPYKPREGLDCYVALMEARVEGVKRWLERSGSMPLRISMSVGPPSWSSEPFPEGPAAYTYAIRLAELLSQYSLRWTTLSLNNLSRAVFDTLAVGDARLLTSLSVRDPWESLEHSEAYMLAISDFLKKTSTRSLCIGQIPDDVLHSERPPPSWAHLTTLTVLNPVYHPPSLFISRLGQLCPSLHTCSWTFASTDGTPSNEEPLSAPREWRNLRKLDISHATLSTSADAIHIDLSNSFQTFTAPSLEELSVTCCGWTVWRTVEFNQQVLGQEYVHDSTPFHNFLLISLCRDLTRLTVDLPIRGQALVRSLEVVPSLSYLQVRRPPPKPSSDSNFLMDPLLNEQLYNALSSTSLCPRLKELELSGCCTSHTNSILELAKARAQTSHGNESENGGSQLQRLKVDFGRQPESAPEVLTSKYVINALEDLRGKGLRVDWEWEHHELPAIDCPSSGLMIEPLHGF